MTGGSGVFITTVVVIVAIVVVVVVDVIGSDVVMSITS
jgi:hypothetical protein